jgi:hypothetical protein
MKQVGVLAAAVVLVVWFVWNLWNLFRIVTGLRDRSWRRPLWWTRACSVAFFAGLASWIWAVSRTGLDVRETCQFVQHQHYDKSYRAAHAAEFQTFFPLHNKCNAHFDLVPPWVNPFLVVCAVMSLAAIAALSKFGIAHLTSLPGKENQS